MPPPNQRLPCVAAAVAGFLIACQYPRIVEFLAERWQDGGMPVYEQPSCNWKNTSELHASCQCWNNFTKPCLLNCRSTRHLPYWKPFFYTFWHNRVSCVDVLRLFCMKLIISRIFILRIGVRKILPNDIVHRNNRINRTPVSFACSWTIFTHYFIHLYISIAYPLYTISQYVNILYIR